LNPSAALRFQQQRSEIMNRVSQRVNYFLHDIVATAGSSSCAVGLATSEPQQHRFPSSRAAFPLARKRRDSIQPTP
ncbi:hypothetical protein, partial [Burkholderia sp. MSMB1078WGS]|uniref:hypothetical protein n=1 Tax=Burkholderia sp. MSMB1078WGS TaxID=1637900 RepID=UPI001C54E31B